MSVMDNAKITDVWGGEGKLSLPLPESEEIADLQARMIVTLPLFALACIAIFRTYRMHRYSRSAARTR
jgi:hypothetical protein